MVNLKVTYKLIKFTAIGGGVGNDPAQPGKWSLMTSKYTFKWYVHHMHKSLRAQLTSTSTLLHPQPCFILNLASTSTLLHPQPCFNLNLASSSTLLHPQPCFIFNLASSSTLLQPQIAQSNCRTPPPPPPPPTGLSLITVLC